MGTAFGLLVKQRLGELGMSQRSFATQVGCSHANINKIINASHEAPPPPLGSSLEQWANVLLIPPAKRQQFFDLAALVHLPACVRPQWEAWYETVSTHDLHVLEIPPTLIKAKRAAESSSDYDSH